MSQDSTKLTALSRNTRRNNRVKSLLTSENVLLSQRKLVNDVVDSILVTVGNGDVSVAIDEPHSVDNVHLAHVGNEGTVYAHELRSWQEILKCLHVHERHDFFAVLKLYPDVVLKSLDVEYVIEIHPDQFVVTFDEHESVGMVAVNFFNPCEPVESLVRHLYERLVADGLE